MRTGKPHDLVRRGGRWLATVFLAAVIAGYLSNSVSYPRAEAAEPATRQELLEELGRTIWQLAPLLTPASETTPIGRFEDYTPSPATWIQSVIAAGILEPFPDHTFRPDSEVPRGELLLAYSRIVDYAARRSRRPLLVQPQPVPWQDVPAGHWLEKRLAALIGVGALSRETDGRLGLDTRVARTEIRRIGDAIARYFWCEHLLIEVGDPTIRVTAKSLRRPLSTAGWTYSFDGTNWSPVPPNGVMSCNSAASWSERLFLTHGAYADIDIDLSSQRRPGWHLIELAARRPGSAANPAAGVSKPAAERKAERQRTPDHPRPRVSDEVLRDRLMTHLAALKRRHFREPVRHPWAQPSTQYNVGDSTLSRAATTDPEFAPRNAPAASDVAEPVQAAALVVPAAGPEARQTPTRQPTTPPAVHLVRQTSPRPAPSKPAPAPEVGPAVVVPVTAVARGVESSDRSLGTEPPPGDGTRHTAISCIAAAEPTPIAISSAIKTNRQREAGRGELIGRIVDALTGKPMPSATLIADHNPVELNADAEFRVQAQGTHAELTAYADGYLTLHMKQPIGRGGEPVTIKLKPQTACLRGVVRDTDNRLPIAGARVRVGNTTVMSDAQGRYVVAGLAPTWHQVECSAPGFMNAIEVLYVTGPTLQRDMTIRSVSVATHFD